MRAEQLLILTSYGTLHDIDWFSDLQTLTKYFNWFMTQVMEAWVMFSQLRLVL